MAGTFPPQPEGIGGVKTNGTRQTLALNLDSKRCEMTDGTGIVASVSFAEDTARFRLAADTVVGSFPFTVAQVTPASCGMRPLLIQA